MLRLFRRDRPGLPRQWRGILDERSGQWRLLDEPARRRLGALAEDLLVTKRWEAAHGFELTEEVRTVIAAHAALLILELDPASYDGVGTIVVREGSMRRTAPMAGPAPGLLVDGPGSVDGEAHSADGPVMVTWRSARHEARNLRLGRDVVLHEFAHKLDMRDGVIDGTPLIADDELRRRWIDVCTARYQAVRAGDSVLRPYAGTNAGEFFAVATETFFTVPFDVQSLEPELYDVLRRYYGQDPAARIRGRIAGAAPGRN